MDEFYYVLFFSIINVMVSTLCIDNAIENFQKKKWLKFAFWVSLTINVWTKY